jgi:hypothetical protein
MKWKECAWDIHYFNACMKLFIWKGCRRSRTWRNITPLTLGMHCRKRKLGCENDKILTMRTRLGVVAACFDAQTVGGGFESVAVVSQIRLASRRVGPIWQSMNDNPIMARPTPVMMPGEWGWKMVRRMKICKPLSRSL